MSQLRLTPPSVRNKQQTAAPLLPSANAEGLLGAWTHVFQAYLQLTKPRIATLIVISTAVGFYFGEGNTLNLIVFFHTIFGTALMAAGSATLNQWYERDIDAKMNRTRRRPIPAGRISPQRALYFGLIVSVLGLLELWWCANALAAALGFLTSLGYLAFYTPWKRKGPICTSIGAIPGAMPPLIGFAAAHGDLTLDAWILFGILFLWQFPHFHAIAWMYREDYERGGIKMLAVVKPKGPALSWEILTTLLLLLPVTLAPYFVHMVGTAYLVAALVLGFVFLYFGVRICQERTYARARNLLLASVVYLPLLLAFLVLDKPRFTI
jgi:protoheme IX farnesyltransferase